MPEKEVHDLYFEWLYGLVCDPEYDENVSYRLLMRCLHSIEFYYILPRDKNRAHDGLDLRFRFAYESNDRSLESYLNGPCSVLEMMIALAIRCEESVMGDPRQGNRTGQWFWTMLVNLDLGYMTDWRFDEEVVLEHVDILLERLYSPEGKGGLFYIPGTTRDMRQTEIWYQMLYFMNTQ